MKIRIDQITEFRFARHTYSGGLGERVYTLMYLSEAHSRLQLNRVLQVRIHFAAFFLDRIIHKIYTFCSAPYSKFQEDFGAPFWFFFCFLGGVSLGGGRFSEFIAVSRFVFSEHDNTLIFLYSQKIMKSWMEWTPKFKGPGMYFWSDLEAPHLVARFIFQRRPGQGTLLTFKN